ncbi:Hypothetical_protein [Hexamita inflata]|uniref:Hypothetical_protein n=1 Tax=Hexamita inflata TaxID=28002 RepID=A0AA86UG57_9EUKA|nr:Hypothetical protein HINF_LOCUS37502 [Hexamita inflata]
MEVMNTHSGACRQVDYYLTCANYGPLVDVCEDTQENIKKYLQIDGDLIKGLRKIIEVKTSQKLYATQGKPPVVKGIYNLLYNLQFYQTFRYLFTFYFYNTNFIQHVQSLFELYLVQLSQLQNQLYRLEFTATYIIILSYLLHLLSRLISNDQNTKTHAFEYKYTNF